MDSELYKKGMSTRRSVLGDDHVDKAIKATTDFDRDFQEYITAGAWGMVWDRPGLTKRERSLITIALLAALGHDEELRMHLKATKNTGASADDVKEVLLHTAVYAGVPVANNAFKLAKELLKDNDQ
jgi:4-carboxymuconolactone decarboxylase